ncbi:P-loop NTPase family protein [Chitinophaga dinghuensis]|nr:ATPase [Chitinophaga dinghuensis]
MTNIPNQHAEQDDSTPMKTKTIRTPYDYHLLVQQLEEHGKTVYGPAFKIEEIDRPVVLKLLAYFLQDEEVAQSEGLDLRKGVFLTGKIGCGKTSLITLMRPLSADAYMPHMVSCREISFEFSKIGYDIISRYSRNAFFPYTDTPRVHCFDDLGVEQPVNHWGNSCNVMAEILLSRYDLWISNQMITHVTTNLNSQELEETYGNRLRSRMRGMFNLIAFNSDSIDKRI